MGCARWQATRSGLAVISKAKPGVSEEGHVSYILAARVSFRPWVASHAGVDQMARLLARTADGIGVRERYLAQEKSELGPPKGGKTALVRERQKLTQVTRECWTILLALRGG